MFVREKTINGYTYLYLVESVREGRRTRQRIIKNLGRKEVVLAAGGLERLAASMARFMASVEVGAGFDNGKLAEDQLRALAAHRIGAPLLFGRLWEETGCRAVLEEPLANRQFAFPVERAIFAGVLHRIPRRSPDRCRFADGSAGLLAADGFGLGPGMRELAGGLPDPGRRRPGAASLLSCPVMASWP